MEPFPPITSFSIVQSHESTVSSYEFGAWESLIRGAGGWLPRVVGEDHSGNTQEGTHVLATAEMETASWEGNVHAYMLSFGRIASTHYPNASNT